MNYLSELFLSAIKLGSWKLQKKKQKLLQIQPCRVNFESGR